MAKPREETRCCISHLFFNAASSNPNQIALINASGGARVCRELHEKIIEDPNCSGGDDEFFNTRRESPYLPHFKGDEVLTFSQVLDSVECLSRRLRRILDGGDDPDLIRPTGHVHGERRVINEVSELPNFVNLTGEQSIDFPNLEIPPQILGIYMVPSIEYIITVLSVLRCGEAFLPLDPSWPKKRILSVISSSKVTLIVRCKSYVLRSAGCGVDKSDWLADQSGCAVLCMHKEENCEEHIETLDLGWPCESKRKRKFCYVLYTSGSTGKPKGVCGTETGLLNRYLWMQELFSIHRGEVLLFKTSISFVDHLQEFLSAILTCIPLVVPPFQELKANPFYIVDFLKAYHISRLIIVPSLMKAILPAIRSQYNFRIKEFLRFLVFSGEALPVSLYDMLYNFLPETTILNLYGSTEVSGDCTYFDCKRLPAILETEDLSSVPIGMPIANCDVVLVGEPSEPNGGEIYVGGLCTSLGYFLDPVATSLNYVKLPEVAKLGNSCFDTETKLYYRTGDFARRLLTGELVFVGRKDRTSKVNGQRVALEEIENVLREHPNVIDAAVIFSKHKREPERLGAYLVLKRMGDICYTLDSSIRSWLVERLPPAMIPSYYSCIESLPLSSAGKIDHALLSRSASSLNQLSTITDATQCDPSLLEVIKEAFGDALMTENVLDNDDFFVMGGDSIAAAQLAQRLGINMRLLYIFPSPSKLLNALLEDDVSYKYQLLSGPEREAKQKSFKVLHRMNDDSPVSCKYLKVESDIHTTLDSQNSGERNTWLSSFYRSIGCSFSRCNKVGYKGKDEVNDEHQACCLVKSPKNKKGAMHEEWKAHLGSCVDASPLVILKDDNVYIFIGSHSHLFVCVDGVSGYLRWEVKLDGRIECSAAIVDDFSLVVVGCYEGIIYFLDFMTGNISWTFRTGGEVKSQPLMDKRGNLIWCGSYDHHLYALDYRNRCCVYNISCGGSIYGSPSIDTVRNVLFVASTKGRVTAILIEVVPFSTLWQYELGVPVFGSLFTSAHGNVICCMVDGHVTVLSSSGSIVWKATTGGPIFAGACISRALPSQVLICSRNGSIYSFDIEEGYLLWEYNIGDPITSSAYVDESMQLISDPSCPSDCLVCICGSSGGIYALRINSQVIKVRNEPTEEALNPVVQEFAKIDLSGDVFSSPIMVAGRIFVGCRDDYVYCIGLDVEAQV